MPPRDLQAKVLNPCRAVRKMLNKHCPGRFEAVVTRGRGFITTHYEEEDLVGYMG
jgi:hypothetical protein